jgi:F-type H+-transporting ATPase subunit delta
MSDDTKRSETARIDGYASAALAVATAEGARDRIVDELGRIAQAVASNEDLRTALADPAVPAERKQSVTADLLGKRAHLATLSLVNLVVTAGRVKDLGAIASRVADLAAATEDLIVAEVRSAVELDQATLDKLTARLESATGRRVKPRVIIDPTLIGGVVAQVGDTVFDGSVRSRLQDLREAWG